MFTSIKLACAVILLTAATIRADDPKFARLATRDLPSSAAPDLRGGVIFPGGALELSSEPSAMILGDLDGPKGARFMHVKLAYRGEYTDPGTRIQGHLYHLKTTNYDRYFFVSRQDAPGAGANIRYVIDFNTHGEPLAYFRGKFAERP